MSVFVLAGGLMFADSATAGKPPNVILILADDLGFGDLAVFGHPYAQTPSLDKLARQGTVFTHFYVAGMTCSPSRTGFMTGRYPSTFPFFTQDRGFGDSLTVTEILTQNGYRTGHFGKWDIGPVTKDGTYGIFEVDRTSVQRHDPNGRDVDIFAAAIEFIEENRELPFYVNIWAHTPHNPINPPPELYNGFPDFQFNRTDFGSWAQENFNKSQFLIDKYRLDDDLATAMRKYLSEIWALDRQIGLLLHKLDELRLRSRTIVIFASDQGPAPVFRGDAGYTQPVNHPDTSKNLLGYAGGLRGGKHEMYEGGVRSPLIIRWPHHVPARRINTTSILSAVDFLPTICAAAGIDVTPMADLLDGENVLDIWLGSSRSRLDAVFWKRANAGALPAMRSGEWKIFDRGSGFELYNLTEDPLETNDLAGHRPEVVERLGAQLSGWQGGLPQSYPRGRVESPAHPIADAGPDQVVLDDDGDGLAWIRLDASGSEDPDGYLSGYLWILDGKTVAVGRSPRIKLPIGLHDLTLEVTDYARLTGKDEVRIEISQ